MTTIHVRPERPGDHDGVRRIHEAAFGEPDEAALVDRLRVETAPTLSLVGERDGAVVGHVFLSPVTLDPPDAALPPSAGLGPVGVAPEHQRLGVGAAMIREALVRCPAIGWSVIFVLGAPAYYGRFGFESAASRGLHYHTHDYDPAFQVLELTPGALGACRGWVQYAPAFGGV